MNNEFDGIILLDTPLLQRAEKLLNWSMSLNDTYSDWDMSLPNPKNYNNKEEQFYAEKVNNLYQNSTAFLLYHELAHSVNGHNSFLGFCTDFDAIELEKESDEFAFQKLVIMDDEKNKIEKGISIMLIFASSLFLTKSFNDIKQKKHPDIDQRIKFLFDKLSFETKENEFYFWYLGCYVLNVFLGIHNISFSNDILYEDSQELFFKYLEEIDKYKIH